MTHLHTRAALWLEGLARIPCSVEIASEAQMAGMRAARPGAHEYEVKAAIESVHRSRGAVSWSFPSIVASGPNATILHYPDADRQMQNGELLLVDARPSDAIALSVRTRTPVFVESRVLDSAKSADASSEQADQERLDHQLLDEPLPVRAERGSNGHLGRTRIDLAEHQRQPLIVEAENVAHMAAILEGRPAIVARPDGYATISGQHVLPSCRVVT